MRRCGYYAGSINRNDMENLYALQ